MYAPDAIHSIYDLCKKEQPSLQLGGITGDARHVEHGGYHISRSLLLQHGMRGDYSIQHAVDKLGDPEAASAIDLTYGETPLMHTVTNRLLAARNDPRMYPVREFFGCQHNGGPIVGWDWSYDGPTTSSDLSHRWHVHISIERKYGNDKAALAGVAAVVLGHPITPLNLLEQIMALDPNSADYKKLVNDVAAAVWDHPLDGWNGRHTAEAFMTNAHRCATGVYGVTKGAAEYLAKIVADMKKAGGK